MGICYSCVDNASVEVIERVCGTSTQACIMKLQQLPICRPDVR